MSHASIGLSVLLVVTIPSLASAQRLPVTAYTTADGLAHNAVNRIVRDSRGFLWFATDDGLARFDGYRFTNFSVEQGLPHRTVTDLLETRAGALWVATFGGLVRFDPGGVPADRTSDPAARAMFTVLSPVDDDPRARSITVLREAKDGTIWCGSRKGLYRLEHAAAGPQLVPVDLGMPDETPLEREVNALVEGRDGALWAASPSGLYRRTLEGITARFSREQGLPDHHVHDLLMTHGGELWAGTRNAGFFRLAWDHPHGRPVVVEHYRGGVETDFLTTWVSALYESSDRRFWIATSRGLIEMVRGADGEAPAFRTHTRKDGLTHQELTALAEDSAGNVWAGTAHSGVMKLARNGFVTYGYADGLTAVHAVMNDRTGRLCFRASVVGPRATGDDIGQRLGEFDGRRFQWFLPAHARLGWVAEGVLARAPDGGWWLGGADGLYRFAASDFRQLATARPLARYTTADGLVTSQVYRLFPDSRGDVWVSTIAAAGNGLARWDRRTETVEALSDAPNLPSLRHELPRAFGEDAAGNIWIGFDTGLARWRGGRFEFFGAPHALPPGNIIGIHADRAGRLWAGSARGGLIHVEGFDSERPHFRTYTIAQGLSSNSIEALAEDIHGRLYVGTSRGLNRLTPETGHVRHFTAKDGLAPGPILTSFRDPTGVLWFGTPTGLSRFVPVPPEPSSPPIAITRLEIAGGEKPLSVLGETSVTLPDLPTDQNHLRIEFVALGFAAGENLRYAYRLDGADAGWTPPRDQRYASYAGLAPGRYRFQVRAVSADGIESATSAELTFTILTPLWRRWWFVSLAALALGGGAVALHRYRIARVLEIGRVRTRIASDLHDDIGANLTRIAILSEVARRQSPGSTGAAGGPLDSIAIVARESVSAMSDIVWAINPHRDTMRDLAGRMRHHAEEVFTGSEVALTFDPMAGDAVGTLGVDLRRDVFLIFKEAVNNAARHARASRVAITLDVEGRCLLLEIIDNGIGCNPAADREGNGLAGMRRRAERLGGTLQITSFPGRGTAVRLVVPFARH